MAGMPASEVIGARSSIGLVRHEFFRTMITGARSSSLWHTGEGKCSTPSNRGHISHRTQVTRRSACPGSPLVRNTLSEERIAFRVLELAPGGLARSRMRYPSDELEPQQRVNLRTDHGGD